MMGSDIQTVYDSLYEMIRGIRSQSDCDAAERILSAHRRSCPDDVNLLELATILSRQRETLTTEP